MCTDQMKSRIAGGRLSDLEGCERPAAACEIHLLARSDVPVLRLVEKSISLRLEARGGSCDGVERRRRGVDVLEEILDGDLEELFSKSITRRSGSCTGRAWISIWSKREKMAAFAPIPSASDRTATAVTKGVLRSVRNASFRLFISISLAHPNEAGPVDALWTRCRPMRRGLCGALYR